MVKKLCQLQPSILIEDNFVSEITESIEIKLEQGKELRERVPRHAHSEFMSPSDWRDPMDILIELKEIRMENPLSKRHGRMIKNRFTFLRGSAALMAYDLSYTPMTGSIIQASGCTLAKSRAYLGILQ